MAKQIISQFPNVKIEYIPDQLPSTIRKREYRFAKINTNNKNAGIVNLAKKLLVIGTASRNQFVERFRNKLDCLCPGFYCITPLNNGCYYSCMYCYLQITYRGVFPYIKINVNLDELKKAIIDAVKKEWSLNNRGSDFNCGEKLDSLSFDNYLELSKILVPFFAETHELEHSTLLMLTKSDNVNNLINIARENSNMTKNTVLSWSLNAEEFAQKYEIGSPSPTKRLAAAKKCQDVGYKIRLRIDPLLILPNWRYGYTKLVEDIFITFKPEYIKEKTGIEPHVGLLRGAENCSPDYSWFPNLSYSITFTTRGCPRRCHFCAVRKHEPKFIVKENWVEDIDITKTGIIFWDNNWLASPNFEKDVKRLMKFRKIGITQIDFNQGLDCRLINEDKVKLLSQIKIKPLRLAFDNSSEDGYIQKAIELAQKYGFKDIRVYVLYNSNDNHDTPEYFYYRINEINKLGALAYPMRYRPIDNINGQYISDRWDKELLRALKLSLMFYYTKGMITKNRKAFENIYGNNAQEFKDKLYKIYQKDKSIKNKKENVD
ncbi:MAG: spore photoproduct lyase family protein [Nitrospirota bacterium]